jgi:magnesium transporter
VPDLEFPLNSPASKSPWIELEALLAEGDAAALARYVAALDPGEPARALAHLSGEMREAVLTLLAPEQAAELVATLPAALAADVVEELKCEPAAAIVAALSGHGQAELLGAMDPRDAESILEAMEPGAASAARILASYEPETAGGLMAPELLSYREEATLAEVLDDLRSNTERYSDYDVQYAYVTDAADRLVGVLRLRDLLLHRPDHTAGSLMIPDPQSVPVDADLDTLETLFDELPFLGMPVVGADRELLGILRRADVESALGERVRSDSMKLAGIPGGEELRSLPTFLRARRRLAWLSTNVVLNVAAASVIAIYQDTLAAVIALAVFLPIISDMSGCSGNQAVAVTMRELSLGLVKPGELLHVLRKEIGVGLINGSVLGLLLAIVAWAWKGNPWLGLVVGVALAANTVLAVCLGGAVPLLLKRLGRDPALASGPILTTCTDMCGFLTVLGLATLLLPRLLT